jgi:hypothetical protein
MLGFVVMGLVVYTFIRIPERYVPTLLMTITALFAICEILQMPSVVSLFVSLFGYHFFIIEKEPIRQRIMKELRKGSYTLEEDGEPSGFICGSKFTWVAFVYSTQLDHGIVKNTIWLICTKAEYKVLTDDMVAKRATATTTATTRITEKFADNPWGEPRMNTATRLADDMWSTQTQLAWKAS